MLNSTIQSELNHAEEALGSAEILLQAHYYRSSISRSYCSIYPVVRAVLRTKGIEIKKRAEAYKLVVSNFKKKDFDQRSLKLISQMQAYEEGFGRRVDFKKFEAENLLHEARLFYLRMTQFLQNERS